MVAAVPLALATGCASLVGTPPDTLIDVSTGRHLDRDELLRRLAAADVVLLGEQHDNPMHHARRGEIIDALRPTAVVAEQMPSGAPRRLTGDLRAALVDAGFDAKAWGWPLHQPVFAAAARGDVPVQGANVTRDQARAIARGGEAAWPEALRSTLERAPLDDRSREALDKDLIAGHCGHLGPDRLPGMRAAQRARDAAMVQALLEAPAGRPAVLIAGNGHVRLDYGVGQLLATLKPSARVASVGFAEAGKPLPSPIPFTYVWVTPAVKRVDPCAGFTMPPRPASPTSAAATVPRT